MTYKGISKFSHKLIESEVIRIKDEKNVFI